MQNAKPWHLCKGHAKIHISRGERLAWLAIMIALTSICAGILFKILGMWRGF